jgi:hypothetical protein
MIDKSWEEIEEEEQERYSLVLEVANLREQNNFLTQERERLIRKLEKIDNLSRYAWTQVRNKPEEAEELFRMINLESK